MIEKPNKFIASLLFFGKINASSYCNVARGFSIKVVDENKI